jgi:hypothetical protein
MNATQTTEGESMQTKLVREFGAAGRAAAEAYTKRANRLAYWRQSKAEICAMQNIAGVITWRADAGDEWATKASTVRDRFANM